jgi:hypothetical protein
VLAHGRFNAPPQYAKHLPTSAFVNGYAGAHGRTDSGAEMRSKEPDRGADLERRILVDDRIDHPLAQQPTAILETREEI